MTATNPLPGTVSGIARGPGGRGWIDLSWVARGKGEPEEASATLQPVDLSPEGRGFVLALSDRPRAFSGRTLSVRWLVRLFDGEGIARAVAPLPIAPIPAAGPTDLRVPAEANPFRSDRVRRLCFRLPSGDVEDLVERLAGQGWRGAIVGPRGAGKTTLLDRIETALVAGGWRVHRLKVEAGWRPWRVFDIRTAVMALGSGDALLLDSAGTLTWPEMLALSPPLSRVGAVVVTAHGPSWLKTLVSLAPTEALLRDLLDQLLGMPPPPLKDTAIASYRARRGNIRDVFADLFDWWADNGRPLALPLDLDVAGDVGAQDGFRLDQVACHDHREAGGTDGLDLGPVAGAVPGQHMDGAADACPLGGDDVTRGIADQPGAGGV